MTQSDLQCRFCKAPLTHTFVDLGRTPLANSYLPETALGKPEPSYPLHARVCAACLLVQVEDVVPAEDIFSDYAYFSSYAASWVAHAKEYAGAMIARFGLGPNSRVVEVASNDGYLLQHFVTAGIPVLGVEPAANVAQAAEAIGVPTDVAFFGVATAQRLRDAGHAADLIAANNVLAHVPDINDFVAGFAVLLKPEGVWTIEFPHLLRLMQDVQFDTIYHEHYSYYSLLVVARILGAHGLRVFDVEELPTHGGSLRVYACHEGAGHQPTPMLAALREGEVAAGLDRVETYAGFGPRVAAIQGALREFLATARAEGKTVAAYGAAAKGNTLLNSSGVSADSILFVADRNPHKQGKFLPGSHIPIRAPEAIFAARPDYLLILPWNLEQEIRQEMAQISEWGGRFVVPIPELRIVD
ncbi:MAG TPA: SAM-dependent methyltransferase [Alphaproteobacteria bacterium]|nr:SAM-dependent methyltransferase [Alphaproteobacteria bacterium]